MIFVWNEENEPVVYSGKLSWEIEGYAVGKILTWLCLRINYVFGHYLPWCRNFTKTF